jgi:hypothetical protein
LLGLTVLTVGDLLGLTVLTVGDLLGLTVLTVGDLLGLTVLTVGDLNGPNVGNLNWLNVGNLVGVPFLTTCTLGAATDVPVAAMPTTLRERTNATTATMVISRCVFIFFLLHIFNTLPRALILTRT